MLSSSSSLFTSLPARPPTPPKDIQEHVKNAFDFLENGHEEAEKDASDSGRQLSTDTPPVSSPVSSQGVNAASTAAKKVGFSPFPPTFHEVPLAGISSSPRDRLLRSTPRPRAQKPVKSILKLSNFAPPPTPDEQEQRLGYFSPEDPSSFGKMLQSVLNELASSSRTSRLDAYLALHGALTAYDGIPDRQAMATNMTQFQQYISRDMTWKTSSDLTDTQIATQALKLACTMVFDTQLSKAMDDDFRVFLIDRSIAVMEQTDMPKALVKTHLYLVAQQKFHPSIITQSRAERMITALRTIEDRCSSNSLIATRLVIYQRLLDQAAVVMSNRLRDWLEHVFHGMLSSVNDTRTRAIEVGNHASLLLGTNPAASKALHDLFETEVEEGQTYCDYLTLRLTSMIGDKQKQAGAFVPQIWSAVILFFRTKRRPLEKWPRLRNWLQVLQKCLNSSDFAIKNQANVAWKKLTFTVMPDASTTPTMLSMLKVPIVAGFEKRGSDRTGKQARQFALDLYHNLLHYSMRPSLSHADLDMTWDAYVNPILSDMIRASQKGRYNACKILHGLLSPNVGLWNELAAMDPNPIKSHDLPRLDPRWVRSRLTKVLALVEPIMSAELWTSEEEHALAARVWQDTLQSIAEAGTQEVRTSNELREAIALVMNLFQRLWKSSPASEESRPLITSTNFQAMMRTTCHYIGPSLLAEDILARTPQGDAEAAPTPSHRPSKHQHALYSPLLFTLSMLCSQPHQADEPQWRSAAAEIMELACKSRATSAAKLQLINRTSQVLHTSCSSPDEKKQVARLWSLFAEQAVSALRHSRTESATTGALGQKLRDALSVVIYGLPVMRSDVVYTDVEGLLIEEIVEVARSAAGDSGVMLTVIEPLSRALLDKTSSIDPQTRAEVAAILLRSAGWPQNRHATEQGRRVLWGVGSGPHKAGAFEPYEHFYSLVKEVLEVGYTQMGHESSNDSVSVAILDGLSSFLDSCPLPLLANALRQIQDGLVIWIKDNERKVFSGTNMAARQQITEIWNRIIDHLAALSRKDGALLSLLQPLFIAGFVSPNRAVVNRTILFWNESFGQREELQYPSELARVLRAARPLVELALPDFPESAADEETIELPAFSGPQDQDSQFQPEATSSSRWAGLPQGTASPVKRTPASHGISSHLASINTGGTTNVSKASSVNNQPKPKARLRHDDSQVLFAPIESSPVSGPDDSQPLTEHQKEVRARQEESAQMFPDLSSTPATKQTPRAKRKTPGKLDFSASAVQEAAAGTPSELPEGHNDMSGYLGSSPTPRSSDKFRPEHIQLEATAGESSDDEPPSSPPRSPHADEAIGQAPGDNRDSSFIADSAPQKANFLAKAASRFDEIAADSDLPSDTALPAEQLRLEAEGAEESDGPGDDSHRDDCQVDATTVVEATEIDLQEGAGDDTPQGIDPDADRVENSFVEPTTVVEPPMQPSPSGSQLSSRSTRKRKRMSTAVESAASKKQKHQSPFRRVFSGMFGASQENDDDVGDEIVVASSQPTDSPTEVRMAEAAEEESQDAQRSVTSSQQPKRGRGRPRKSETPTPAPLAAPPASSTRSKRKAAALADPDDSDSAASESKSTAAAKRQRRRARNKKALEDARNSKEDVESRPSSRREATAVVIEKPVTKVEVTEARVPSSDEEESGEESQESAKQEAATPSEERPKATPKSILGRLKDILGDCKNAIFGSQEEREFDDVLFELRREVHGGARRER